MIIGNGLLANSLLHYKNTNEVIIFASGVSNSICNDDREFEREFLLLKDVVFKKNTDQKLVYFSTFNVFDPSLAESKYVLHKKNIESFLSKIPGAMVIRLPIVLANSNNPN